MDDQAYSNQQMRGTVQYQNQQHNQIQQSREQQFHNQKYRQVCPTFQQQQYDDSSQYVHVGQQQSLYNQQSYQLGYNQQHQASAAQYYPMQEDDDGIIVAENCVVMTSDPFPDQLMSQQSSIGAHYPAEQQASRYQYAPLNDGVPSSSFYGQVRPQQQHREPHYVIVDPLTYSAGFQQLHSQKAIQKQTHQRQIIHSNSPVQQGQRRSAPFEEEEEEMEESDEDSVNWCQQSSIQSSSNQRQKINVDEPRMTRAARRKQNFEIKSKPDKQKRIDAQKKISTDIFSDEADKLENSTQKFEKKIISGTWAAVSPKKEANSEKPLFDKNIAHIQAVQRLSTSEGWSRMNEWLKSSIKTMDLAKLRQLLAQLIDADITVDLLRDNDTPKLIKDLQKCADKGIAIFATKMVTKWKQTIRDGNKEKQVKIQQQQHQPTKVKAEKPSGVGVAALTKNIKRTSTELDTGNGPSTSQIAVQVRPRSGSISTAVVSNQQQIGARSNSLNSQKAAGLNKTNESSLGAQSKQKTIAKAKAKISRPRLTGLEGDEPSPAVSKPAECSIGNTKIKNTTTVVAPKTASSSTAATSVSESPLARIMAATTKFHAEQQPKRKSVEVVFSDNFMDSLSAVDVAKPKKAKIVRKKLNEREDLTKSELRDSSATIDENEANADVSVTKKRVKFFDEIGRNLVDVRFFEVEEGERINVTKMGGMDKEAIKHLDSQREKQFLLDARRHGFGSTTQTTGGGYSSTLMDPSLMPPGHGRIFGGPQQGGASTSQFRVPETRYPWRLLPVECQTIINVESGCRSDAKVIETQRQCQQLPAIVLPTALPISDIDPYELKKQREEGMMQMPKIIPLDLVTEVFPQKQTEDGGMNFGLSKIDLSPKKKEVEPEEMIVDETEPKLEDYEVYENEGLRSPSPERPPINQIPSSDEDLSDDNKDKLFIGKNNPIDFQEEENDVGIASPEPEHLNESIDSGSSSIKEIPIEQLKSLRDFGDEDDKEDLDIRDQQLKLQKQPDSSLVTSSTSNSLTSAPSTLSSTNLQAFKKIPNLNSLLQKINTIVGTTAGTTLTTLTTSAGSAYEICNKEEAVLSEKNVETDNDLAIDNRDGDALEKIQQQNKTLSIPPPPAPLYPSSLQLPIGHPPPPGAGFQSNFLPQMINAPRIFPPHHSDFSIPPPPIPGIRFGFSTQSRLPGGQQQQSTNVSLTNDSQKQDGIPGQHQEMLSIISKTTGNSSEIVEGQRRQISPGPPGLDEGGSPPPSLEQNQQQKSPSSMQIPQTIKQPFSSHSPNVLMIQQRQQNISSPQLSLDEAKEIAGICQFYKRTGTCNFGERCKFAHDDEHITFGVQMAMRGVSIPNRGGIRGGRGGSVNVARTGAIRGSPQVDSESGASGFEKRTSRRSGGTEKSGRRLDYDISPVRGDSSENNSVRGVRDRRYTRIPPQRRRSRSRSKSRDRYNRRRRSRSRSRNERRRARSSSSSSSSRSGSTRSRSSTPQRARDRKRSRSPVRRRRDYSRQRYRLDYYRRISPRRRSSSSSSLRRRRRSSSSSSLESPGKRKNSNDNTVKENKNSGDTDTGTPILVLSDETIVEGEKNLKISDSVVMEENKE